MVRRKVGGQSAAPAETQIGEEEEDIIWRDSPSPFKSLNTSKLVCKKWLNFPTKDPVFPLHDNNFPLFGFWVFLFQPQRSLQLV
ncbi:hypothetical protein Sjap_018414 [Stephania japonica]|uniref:Uncharacterized protein n=1 Tax=Stephania japonica TaxID=461633 RepID=A0AAP0I7Z2_9MAGN